MILIIILLVHLLLIVLEVSYDTCVHKSKSSTNVRTKVKYAQIYHALQLVIFGIIFLYGFHLADQYRLISWFMLAVVANYVATRIWLFNPIYNSINDLAGNYLSSSELYDRTLNRIIKWFIRKFSIRAVGIVTMFFNIVKAALYFASIYYLIINA